MNYDLELRTIVEAMKAAYGKFYTHAIDTCREKAQYDVVTNIDYNIEAYIINILTEAFPEDRILSEETNADTLIEGRTWTIDPIDGTYNMTKGIPLFGVQCSLFEHNEVVAAAVYLPYFNECYTAVKGHGAFLNQNKISVTPTDLEHSVVSFGDFPHFRANDRIDELKIVTKLADSIAKIRMFGSACIDFCYLAAGRTNGVVIFTKNKWDISPGILIAKEAGAFIHSLEGAYTDESQVVIATATQELYGHIRDF